MAKPKKKTDALAKAREAQKALKASGEKLRTPAVKGERPLQQIRRFCLECVGGSSDLVKACTGFTCPLWALRFGSPAATVRRKNPELLDHAQVRKEAADRG